MAVSVTVIHLVKKTARKGSRTTTQQLIERSLSSSGVPRVSATVDQLIHFCFLSSQRSCVRGARIAVGW